MKTKAAMVAFLAALPLATQAAEGAGAVVTLRPTPEEVTKLQMSHKVKLPEGALEKPVDPNAGERPDEAVAFMERSVFLSDNARSVLLPAGAVVLAPGEKQTHVSKNSSKPLVSWDKFLLENRSWLKELPLTVDEIMGRKEIDKQQVRALALSGAVVVCTYMKQPVAPASQVRDAFQKTIESK